VDVEPNNDADGSVAGLPKPPSPSSPPSPPKDGAGEDVVCTGVGAGDEEFPNRPIISAWADVEGLGAEGVGAAGSAEAEDDPKMSSNHWALVLFATAGD
jgi:hypothetical protein